jgi:hypothetical protein
MPAGASPKTEERTMEIQLKKMFVFIVPAALAPTRRKFFLTSGRAN